MNNYITMSQKELNRVSILQKVLDKKITSIQASNALEISDRQFRRIKVKQREEGDKGLVHKGRGKSSNNRISDEVIEQIKTIIRDELYEDFKPTFMSEQLLKTYDIKISIEKLRQIMVETGVWIVKSRRSVKQRKKRKRKDSYGDMEQFDGSYHLWLEYRNGGIELCLLLAIDDATGRITYAKFTQNEGKEAVLEFWKEYILLLGKPVSVYLDKFSTYKVNHPKATFEPELVTEFGRICQTLGINMITANSPQAKGRVERGNKTLQDRLIKEMRIRGIDNVEDANRYLQEEFIDDFNKRFAVIPATEIDSHRKLTEEEEEDLDWIFSEHKTRVINNDYTVTYKKRYYQLYQGIPKIYPKLKVTVEEQFNGKIRITYRDKEVKYEKIEERPPKYTRKELEEEEEEKTRKRKELEQGRFKKSKEKQAKYRAKILISKLKSVQLEKEKAIG